MSTRRPLGAGHEPVLNVLPASFNKPGPAGVKVTVWTVDSKATAAKYPQGAQFVYWVAPYLQPISAGPIGDADGDAAITLPAPSGEISKIVVPIAGLLSNPAPVSLSTAGGPLNDGDGTHPPTKAQNLSQTTFDFNANLSKDYFVVYGMVTDVNGNLLDMIAPTIIHVT